MDQFLKVDYFLMKYINYIPVSVVLFGILLREVALWCNYELASCAASTFFHSIFHEFINPFHTFALYFLVPSVVILFVTPRIVKSWLIFAIYWLPLSALIIAYAIWRDNSSWSSYFFYSPNQVAAFMATLFTIISLGIIGWKQFVSKK